jgi:crossover junction endodeoxyribonuclease RusA
MRLQDFPPEALRRALDAGSLPENLRAQAQRLAAPPVAQTRAEHGEVVVVLDIPPRELSPNARVHWAAKARAVKAYRAAAMQAAALVAPGWRWERAEASAVYYFAEARRRDADNLLAMLKPAFDGIAEAGLLVNDSGLVHQPVRVEIDAANPRVEIILQRIDAPP